MPKLTRGMAAKLRWLLEMEYTPAEIARELGITPKTIKRSYLTAGAPYRRDSRGRVFIVGTHFYQWAEQYAMARSRKRQGYRPMQDEEAYCTRCNKAVVMQSPRIDGYDSRGVANKSGRCPDCGGRIFRFIQTSREQAGADDQPYQLP